MVGKLPDSHAYLGILSKLLSKYYLSRMIVIMERYEDVDKSTNRPVLVLVVPRGDPASADKTPVRLVRHETRSSYTLICILGLSPLVLLGNYMHRGTP